MLNIIMRLFTLFLLMTFTACPPADQPKGTETNSDTQTSDSGGTEHLSKETTDGSTGPETSSSDSESTEGADNAVCGNGIVESDEQCDDGNLDYGDGCNGNCRIETFPPFDTEKPCVQFCQACYEGVNVYYCVQDHCKFKKEYCQEETDAFYACLKSEQFCLENMPEEEVCVNEGDAYLLCNVFCGDAVVLPEIGEQCDDGNHVNGDGCSDKCQLECNGSICPVPL